jgi:DNA polymerase
LNTNESKNEKLRQIRDEVLALKSSPLYSYRLETGNLPVIGEGDHEAKIMFVGEAPGRNEAKTGRPFCGAAGKILDDLLAGAGIKREEVYITNIVKDRPPQNRDPLPEEIISYAPFLDRQIEIIRPEVIATLGRYAMGYVMNRFGLFSQLDVISKMHGQTFSARASYGPITIVPLYHPAAAIYNQALRPALADDFKILKKFR